MEAWRPSSVVFFKVIPSMGANRKTKGSPEGAEAEDTDALLDLLSCPHSPWQRDTSWSPQAPALRQLAVLAPERLHTGFIYNYFTALRIVDEGVSVIDDSLLKFSKLEELVLSNNKISEIPPENLPSSLKMLELRANRLSALNSLTNGRPPRLQPQLVCLDLSDCEFKDQQALLSALSTLPCLRTLVLEGNPFTLAPSYPGFTVDSLPRLSCLDTSWISADERQCFRGLAKSTDLIVDRASATVSVGGVKGIPNPSMRVAGNAENAPVVNYGYFITYEFLSHQTVNLVLSWPAASEDVPVANPSRPVKEKKSVKVKESPIKSGSTKDKSTDKKKKPVPQLVQDAPIRRVLQSVHVPLQSLLTGAQQIDDLGKKIKEDMKKDKESKQRGGSGTKPKNIAASKGIGPVAKDLTDAAVWPIFTRSAVVGGVWRGVGHLHLCRTVLGVVEVEAVADVTEQPRRELLLRGFLVMAAENKRGAPYVSKEIELYRCAVQLVPLQGLNGALNGVTFPTQPNQLGGKQQRRFNIEIRRLLTSTSSSFWVACKFSISPRSLDRSASHCSWLLRHQLLKLQVCVAVGGKLSLQLANLTLQNLKFLHMKL
ncbi:Leucine-rich repeat-containing protein 43 [Liparis tanakae]|uniref:Leucine-rich repeat-containing protein 43 n=1 Tax=Liparis tanakae TaxID=230148 RepID=A0A4Z2GP72_9TELE|nr:Leucine-rich repeat-containing protein 43 [Liparis tanakae]